MLRSTISQRPSPGSLIVEPVPLLDDTGMRTPAEARRVSWSTRASSFTPHLELVPDLRSGKAGGPAPAGGPAARG